MALTFRAIRKELVRRTKVLNVISSDIEDENGIDRAFWVDLAVNQMNRNEDTEEHANQKRGRPDLLSFLLSIPEAIAV